MGNLPENESGSDRPTGLISGITFFVPGKPISKGRISYSRQGRGYYTNQDELGPWEHNIGYCAKMAKVPRLNGPVRVELEFRLLKPKSVKRDFPCVLPDLDKYIRAVFDALTKIAYTDDGQVVWVQARKIYSDTQGVEITVSPFTSV